MTNRLQNIYDITTNMLKLLNSLDNNNREYIIQEITELIEKRDLMVKEVKPPYSDEELIIGKRVTKLNNTIQAKMDTLFNQVKQDIIQLKQNKSSNLSYINPYGQIKTTDGLYLDSKQ